MKKVIDTLFSTRASGMYTLIFAFAIAAATFIENDFGTSSAQKVVYRTGWFELLLILFGTSIIVNIFRYKMVQQKKWATFTFHASVIVILIGAAVTRYLGSEGMMHIREGDTSNQIVSSETFLQFSANYKGNEYQFDESVYFATLGKNKFKKSYLIGDQELMIDLKEFIPNPAESIVENEQGVPIIKMVTSGSRGREEYILKYHDFKKINGTSYNFGNSHINGAINIKYENNRLSFSAPSNMTQMTMATQELDTLSAQIYHPLLVRTLYTGQSMNMVISDFKPNARVQLTSVSPKVTNESICALRLLASVDDQVQQVIVTGNRGLQGVPKLATLGGLQISISYGSKPITLPFAIRLKDFIMERYPGTNSASSYASEVTLIDNRKNVERNQRIYMNNILNYGGYRFFQSSYDRDELGTVLSVNHDFWGTWISYIGYFLLTLGMVLVFVSPKSRFRFLSNNLRKMQKANSGKSLLTGCLLMLLSGFLPAQSNINVKNIDKTHAAKFGQLTVQDYRGRMKPVNTLSSEVIRKISRKESLFGQSSDQIILNMIAFPDEWTFVPIIKMGKDEKIRALLGKDSDIVSYNDFFKNGYVLQDQVRTAYEMEQRNRGTFEKEILKLDERVNITNMIFTGGMLRLFPISEDPSSQWQAPGSARHNHGTDGEVSLMDGFYSAYIASVREASKSNDWSEPNNFIIELANYQQTNGGSILPSSTQTKMEIWLNKMQIFSRLGKYYGLLGLVFLAAFFISAFNHKKSFQKVLLVAAVLMGLGFIAHTVGLGFRWYVSERAPWSNGYESMIYIAWTTILSGLIFARRSFGGLAATTILASIILMVAGMSWLDPEITPLVPVLKSYWLTIHVSLIAGSYGFLMLGAIIGVINLILMIFSSAESKSRNDRTIKEMTYTSEMTLIAGLVMLAIGTYLGGVWANESWGRYWGWDAKETWALVTILIYTFILHMRFIPGLRGPYAFNVATLFGFASVMMTYFGVNYYLSGLHSYAAGDPVPVPGFVYYTAIILTVISLLAMWKNKLVLKALKS